jgi:hypothetical protein
VVLCAAQMISYGSKSVAALLCCAAMIVGCGVPRNNGGTGGGSAGGSAGGGSGGSGGGSSAGGGSVDAGTTDAGSTDAGPSDAGSSDGGTASQATDIAFAAFSPWTGIVGAEVGPMVVRVTDASSNPVEGVTVTWAVTGSNGSVESRTSETNAYGVTWIHAWLGAANAGVNTFSASVPGLHGSPVSFLAKAAILFEPLSGNGQTGVAGTALPYPLAVAVMDGNREPVPDIDVRWSGAVSPQMTATNMGGIAMVNATLTHGGANTFVAMLPDLRGLFFVATGAQVIALQTGNNQMASVGAPFPSPLAVRVDDGSGNPVRGINVTWAAQAGQGLVSPMSTTTDDAGIAIAYATAGAQGQNTFAASVPGLAGSPVMFVETSAP